MAGDLGFFTSGRIQSETLAPEFDHTWETSNQAIVSRLMANGYSLFYLADLIMSGGRIVHVGTPTYECDSSGRERIFGELNSSFAERTGYGLYTVTYLLPLPLSSLQPNVPLFPPAFSTLPPTPTTDTCPISASPVNSVDSPIELHPGPSLPRPEQSHGDFHFSSNQRSSALDEAPTNQNSTNTKATTLILQSVAATTGAFSSIEDFWKSVMFIKEKGDTPSRRKTRFGALNLKLFCSRTLELSRNVTGFILQELWTEDFLKGFPLPTSSDLRAIVKRINKSDAVRRSGLEFRLKQIGSKGRQYKATLERAV